jgi:hypothetical protein
VTEEPPTLKQFLRFGFIVLGIAGVLYLLAMLWRWVFP